jgi:hypothetical protein
MKKLRKYEKPLKIQRPAFEAPRLITIVLLILLLSQIGAVAQTPPQIAAPAQFPLGASPNALAHGDFNSDGFEDVASANSGFPDDTVTVLLNDGTGRFGSPIVTVLADYPVDLASADFNGDGKDDLVVSELGSIQLLLSNGNGTFTSSSASTLDNTSIAVGDFNADGNADFAAGCGNVSVSLGDGSGHFTFTADYPVIDSQGLYVITADFNGDGRVDIAAGDDNDVVVLLRGRGDGTFILLSKYLTGGYHLIATDVNNDGRPDLLGDSLVSNELSVSYATARGLAAPAIHTFASLMDAWMPSVVAFSPPAWRCY